MTNQFFLMLGLALLICAWLLDSQMKREVRDRDPTLVLIWWKFRHNRTIVREEHARLFPQSNKRKLFWLLVVCGGLAIFASGYN
jgi:hypothetical protein